MPLAVAAFIVACVGVIAGVGYPYAHNTTTDDDAWKELKGLLDRIGSKFPSNVSYISKSSAFGKGDFGYAVVSVDMKQYFNIWFTEHWYKSNELTISVDATAGAPASPSYLMKVLGTKFAVALTQKQQTDTAAG